jgi:hypothetical protein
MILQAPDSWILPAVIKVSRKIADHITSKIEEDKLKQKSKSASSKQEDDDEMSEEEAFTLQETISDLFLKYMYTTEDMGY